MPAKTIRAPRVTPFEDALHAWLVRYAKHALVGTWKMPPFRATLDGAKVTVRFTVGAAKRVIEEDSSALLVLAARFWGATRPAKAFAIARAALPAFSAHEGFSNNTADWFEDFETDDAFEDIVLELATAIGEADKTQGALVLLRWVEIYQHEKERIPARLRAQYFAEVGAEKVIRKRMRLSPQILAKLVAPHAKSADPIVQIHVARRLIQGTGHLSHSDHGRYEALVGPLVKKLLGRRGAVREAALAIAEHLAWHLWWDCAFATAKPWFEAIVADDLVSPHVLRGLWACQTFLDDPEADATWKRANAIASADGKGRGVRATFPDIAPAATFRRAALRRMADCFERLANGQPASPKGKGRLTKAEKARAAKNGPAWAARAEALRREAG